MSSSIDQLGTNLRKTTVTQIKKWAKEQNIIIPSSISRKADIIYYIQCAVLERQQGTTSFESKTLPLADLIPVNQPEEISWRQHLMEHGWAVAPIPGWADVEDKNQITTNFQNTFFDWLESSVNNETNESTLFKRDDRSTWIAKNLPPNIRGGMFKQFLGHLPFQWQIRTMCRPLFAEIWQVPEDQLLSSFDGGSFNYPKKDTSFKEWFHVDQARPLNGVSNFECVQGIVHLNDNLTHTVEDGICTAADGGLVLIENSRDVFDSYMAKYSTYGHTWGYANIEDPLLADKRLIRILAPAGHITLWDSRMFHAGSPPCSADGNNYRMCLYVSMQPKIGADKATLAKRTKAFQDDRLSSHWCYGKYFSINPKLPRTYGNSYYKPVYEKAQLTADQLTMIA